MAPVLVPGRARAAVAGRHKGSGGWRARVCVGRMRSPPTLTPPPGRSGPDHVPGGVGGGGGFVGGEESTSSNSEGGFQSD